ncbi:hypothetical protein PG987_001918 [Apiospora arundinis]
MPSATAPGAMADDAEKTDTPPTGRQQTVSSTPSEAVATGSHDGLEQQPEYVTGIRLVLVITSAIVACFLMLVDTMVISTAIPRITDEFRSLADVGWYAGVYQFGIAAPQPLVGKIYTHFKTKWTFLCFFLLFELGSLLCVAPLSTRPCSSLVASSPGWELLES